MKKPVAVGALVLTVVSSLAFSCDGDQLPLKDRTAKNLAQHYGHLRLKNIKQVIRKQDTFAIPEDSAQNLMPDQGVVSLQLIIDSAEVPSVMREAHSLGFQPVSSATGDTLLPSETLGKDKGFSGMRGVRFQTTYESH